VADSVITAETLDGGSSAEVDINVGDVAVVHIRGGAT